MKKLVSGPFILAVAALTLAFGCGEGIEGETGSQSAEVSVGECNRIVARTLGVTQQCSRNDCSPDQCAVLLGTFDEFFGSECAGAFFAGELNGLAGSALGEPGDPKHIQEVICSAAEACDPTCDGIQAVGLCLDTEACPSP